MGCVACVPEDQLFVIEQFGAYNRTAEPGFACVGIPYVHTVKGTISRRIHQVTVCAETKTKDNVFVTVAAATQYKVIMEKAMESFYTLDSPINQLRTYVFDVIRATVPKMLLDEVFASKSEIADAIKSQLQKEMGDYGFAIIDTLIVDISPAARVKQSMNSINEHKRLRKATEERAEAEKLVMIKAAEAEAEYQHLQGQGIARQRHAIMSGIQESVKNFSSSTNIAPKQVTDLVIVNQYFDTIKELAKSNKSRVLFINDDDSNSEFRDQMLQSLMANFPLKAWENSTDCGTSHVDDEDSESTIHTSETFSSGATIETLETTETAETDNETSKLSDWAYTTASSSSTS